MIVVWRVTSRCNLACGFCAYDRRLPLTRIDVDAARVTRLAPVLADYARVTGDSVLVSWIGGEPLLWKPFIPLSAWLRDTLGIRVSTTTNGTTLHNDGVRAAVLSHLDELTVSVDGPAPFHDAVRGWPGGWVRLKTAVTALAAARAVVRPGLRLRANVVLMHANLSGFAALCDELAGWGFDDITFNQLGGRDRPAFFASERLTPDDARALRESVPALRQRLAARGVTLCGTVAYLDRIAASAAGAPLAVDDCGPGQRFLFIDEHGVAAPCNFTSAEYGIPIDGLRGVDDLLALPRRFAAMRTQARAAACADCPSTQVFAKFDRPPAMHARTTP